MNLKKGKFLSFLWGVSIMGINRITKDCFNINFLFAFFGLLIGILMLVSAFAMAIFMEPLAYSLLLVILFMALKIIAYVKLERIV